MKASSPGSSIRSRARLESWLSAPVKACWLPPELVEREFHLREAFRCPVDYNCLIHVVGLATGQF